MPLTWWIVADIHINEDDPLQQNLNLTLQAMAMDRKEEDNKIKIVIHKEVESTVNVIFEHELKTWMDWKMKKVVIFTTGQGDLLFKILFSSSATSFLQTEAEAKLLKTNLEVSLLSHFGISVSPRLIQVTRVAIQGEEMPTLTCDSKVAVVVISTQDLEVTEVGENPVKERILHSVQPKSWQEVSSPFSTTSFNTTFIPDFGGEASDIELMNMF